MTGCLVYRFLSYLQRLDPLPGVLLREIPILMIYMTFIYALADGHANRSRVAQVQQDD
jgi:hypothetical protein